ALDLGNQEHRLLLEVVEKLQRHVEEVSRTTGGIEDADRIEVLAPEALDVPPRLLPRFCPGGIRFPRDVLGSGFGGGSRYEPDRVRSGGLESGCRLIPSLRSLLEQRPHLLLRGVPFTSKRIHENRL